MSNAKIKRAIAENKVPSSMTITVKSGEYRVNFRGGKEASAYYTNDLDDAVDTAILMAGEIVDDLVSGDQPDKPYTRDPAEYQGDYPRR